MLTAAPLFDGYHVVITIPPQGAVAQAARVRLRKAATSEANVFDELVRAARACSLGQIRQTFFEGGGQYRRDV